MIYRTFPLAFSKLCTKCFILYITLQMDLGRSVSWRTTWITRSQKTDQQHRGNITQVNPSLFRTVGQYFDNSRTLLCSSRNVSLLQNGFIAKMKSYLRKNKIDLIDGYFIDHPAFFKYYNLHIKKTAKEK